MPSWVLFTIYIPAETEKQPKVTSKSLEYDLIVLRKTEQKHFADSKLQNNVIFCFYAQRICPMKNYKALLTLIYPTLKLHSNAYSTQEQPLH